MDDIEIFKLFGSILVDSDEANKSISKTGKESEGLASKMGKGIKTAGKWALGITTAAVGIGAAAFAMTKKVTAGFDDIAKNSRKMGVSTDYYQEMEYWASQNGLSHENMEKSMKRLNQRLGQAVEGNEKYSNALTRLGVDLEEVEKGNVSTEQAMTQSIQALSEIENSQEKAALASELFGTKLSQELMPAIDSGALSIEDAQKKAEELGIVIAEDTLNAAEEFNDTWDDLTRSFTAFSQKILAQLMPAFQSMMDWVMAHMPQIQAVFSFVFDAISWGVSTVIGWIGALISWLQDWFTSNNDTVNGIWEVIQTVFTTVVEFLEETWALIMELWSNHGQSLLENARTIFNSIWDTVETVFSAVWEIIQTILGLVVPFIQEQLSNIYEFWDEHGQQIAEAVSNVFNFIKGIIEFVMPVITAIIKGAWAIISAVFETAIGVIMGIVKYFISMFTGDFTGMKDALIGIWNALWDGIKGVVSGAWSLLSGAFTALWTSISGWFTGIKDDAVNWGKNMIQGFIDGIKNMAGKVKDAAKGVIDNVTGFLKFWSPAKEGEGRFITDWGENMVDGFLDGVRNETSEAGKVMNDLIESMSPKFLDFNATQHLKSSNAGGGSELNSEEASIGSLVELMMELIKAVKEGKNIWVDNDILGRVTDEEQGRRINMTGRRVEV